MTHIAFTPKGRDVDLLVDWIVVGSGAGGASAAVTLARGGDQVAVVEAGPWRDPEDYPSSTYGAMRDMMDDWGSQVTLGRAYWPIVQARLVGGTTVVNSAIAVRTPGDIFAHWQSRTGVGGNLADPVWAAQDQVEDELCVSETSPAALGRSNELALQADAKLGYGGYVMKRYVKDCEGSGQCLQGCRGLRKQSTNLNYLPEVIERGGTVVSCAPVHKVEFSGRRATSVVGRFVAPGTGEKGARFTVRARRGIFIGASVTHTPGILRRSGLRNRMIGREFRAHPGTGVFGIYDDPVDPNVGATQGWASTKFRTDPGLKLETLSIPLELVASRFSGGGTTLMSRLARYRHVAMWMHAIRAESVGRIVPVGNKPLVFYTLDRADMERFRKGMVLVARMHFAAGARAIIPGIFGMPFELGPDDLDQVEDAPLDPRAYVAVLSHLFGGAVMGKDPARSVVDGDGRAHDCEGLWVCDASVIPSNLGVNPQHTIMGLAHVFAERALAS